MNGQTPLTQAEAAITRYCECASGTDVIAMALGLMQQPEIRLHGPEHHYLTAAVLMTAYCNAVGRRLGDSLDKLRVRCALIPAGVCGYYGVCGDVLAAGAFWSLLSGATYLSGKEWGETGRMAAACQNAVAESSGPRCCKRSTLTALIAAVDYVKVQTGVDITGEGKLPPCQYAKQNRECIGKACRYNQSYDISGA